MQPMSLVPFFEQKYLNSLSIGSDFFYQQNLNILNFVKFMAIKKPRQIIYIF
jgi:hypothetical protein